MMTFCFCGNSDSRRINRHVRKVTSGRTVERDRGAVSGLPAVSGWWANSQRRPAGADGDLVRLEDRDRLGGFASGPLRLLPQDMPTAYRGVDPNWTMAAHARVVPGQASRSRQARLVSCARRLQLGESSAGRAKTGPNPT